MVMIKAFSNWGFRVAALYTGFILLMVFMVYQSARQRMDLVTPNYYTDELMYQARIDARNRFDALEKPMVVSLSARALHLALPKSLSNGMVKGQVLIYRPSDKALDQVCSFQGWPYSTFNLPINSLPPGRYKLECSFTQNGVGYWTEMQVDVYKE